MSDVVSLKVEEPFDFEGEAVHQVGRVLRLLRLHPPVVGKQFVEDHQWLVDRLAEFAIEQASRSPANDRESAAFEARLSRHNGHLGFSLVMEQRADRIFVSKLSYC